MYPTRPGNRGGSDRLLRQAQENRFNRTQFELQPVGITEQLTRSKIIDAEHPRQGQNHRFAVVRVRRRQIVALESHDRQLSIAENTGLDIVGRSAVGAQHREGRLYASVVENSRQALGVLPVAAIGRGEVNRFPLAERKAGSGTVNRTSKDIRQSGFREPSAMLVKLT